MQGGQYPPLPPQNPGYKSPTPSMTVGQQRPYVESRPPLPRIGSNQAPQPPPQRQIHVIVRLPYPRPLDAPVPPTQVVWSAEKEKILWSELSRSWTNLYAIDWARLSTQLDVPVPYLLYRAQVKYEEDLKGLQGIRQGPPSAGPLTSPISDDRQRLRPSFTQSGSNPLSPNIPTPKPYLPRRTSSSGLSSRSTIIQPNSATRMIKMNPVLTPVKTGDTSPTASTPSESDDSETERKDAQREEADQLAQKLHNLQKMMRSGAFGFAKTRPRPLENSGSRSSAPSITTRSQSGTATATLAKRSVTAPGPGAMRSGTPTSASAASISAQESSIPDIPSPAASDSRARLPVRVTRRATSASTRRSPSTTVSDAPEGGGRVGKIKAQEVGSGQVSGSSSFSDFSDGDMSASALEDALMSNNFKSTTTTSRLLFSRHPRGQASVRHRYS